MPIVYWTGIHGSALTFFACRDTYIAGEPGESPNDRNDRAIRVAAAWYDARLPPSMPILFLTNDAENRRKAQEAGLRAMTVQVRGLCAHTGPAVPWCRPSSMSSLVHVSESHWQCSPFGLLAYAQTQHRHASLESYRSKAMASHPTPKQHAMLSIHALARRMLI